VPPDTLRITAVFWIGGAPCDEVIAVDAGVETTNHQPKPALVVTEVGRIDLRKIRPIIASLGENVAECRAQEIIPSAAKRGDTSMSEKPDFEHGIYRVDHTLRVGMVQHTCQSDLIFIMGNPFVVLEWGGPSGSQKPKLTLPLDAKFLSPPSPEGYYVYSGPTLVDPRSVQ
jgi:hypothetical protein